MASNSNPGLLEDMQKRREAANRRRNEKRRKARAERAKFKTTKAALDALAEQEKAQRAGKKARGE